MESEEELFAEFEKKYIHIKDFYKLKSIHQSSDLTIVHLQFICVQCLPKNKLLKSTSQAPFSNLKAHLANVHSSSAAKFDTIKKDPKKRTIPSQQDVVSKKPKLDIFERAKQSKTSLSKKEQEQSYRTYCQGLGYSAR